MSTKENQSIAGFQAHIGRLTRSRSAALRAALPPVPPVQVNKPKGNPQTAICPNLGGSKGKSKKLVGSDENERIRVGSNLARKGKKVVGLGENAQIGGKLKKLGLDESAQIRVSANLGGKSKKLGSSENLPIEIDSNLGVSIAKGKKLRVSDENSQIGAKIQKGRAKRPALGEITNNVGASLKLSRPDLDKGKGKRPALEDCTGTELGFPNKRRSVLKGVSDFLSAGKYKLSVPVPKNQTKVLQGAKLGSCKANREKKEGTDAKLTSLSHINSLVEFNNNNVEERELNGSGQNEMDPLENLERETDVLFLEESDGLMINNDSNSTEGDTISSSIINIDGEKSNTLLCTVYASEVYNNLRATELIKRPSSHFMDSLQKDVTQSMRAILVDWLVEVCDEYRLVPDTLYLTVYLIDRFLSLSYIERQKLQLVGITCMLIASKYEEICAPRVDEFCFITDNTYTKTQVLQMENQVLSVLGYCISVPTAKTFLRRFLRAAQASTKAPPTLMHLTNYLTELTLVEYNFMKYLPSEIAASAIFLAQWTLDQSDHPWNETLEHYTRYKSSDLRASILLMQELQLNTQNCTLKAIRDKYKQEKFESVANLKSPELLESLFC